MSSLKLKCGNAKGRLTRAATFIETINSETPIEMLEIRVQKLDESWTDFSMLHHELLREITAEEVNELENEFSDYEDRYFKAYSSLMKAIRERQSVVNDPNKSMVDRLADQQAAFLETLNTSASNATSINLPKITVPPFSGSYKDWPSFRDLFTGSIDNRNNLSATQKFHYLKSFLRDEAANLIKHIPITDTNYIEAWKRLENRYDRVHLIVQSYIQSFLSLPSIQTSNAQGLRKLTDGADEVIRGLNAVDRSGRDPWLIYLLLNKVDGDTKQAWAEHIGTRDDCSVSDFLTFLQSRCDALESCQSLIRPVTTRNKPQIKSHLAESSSTKTQCPKCKGDHILPQCSQFVGLDIHSRRNFVKSNALCFNCLRVGHAANKCRSTFRCKVCKSHHHSLVHPLESEKTLVPDHSSEPQSIATVHNYTPNNQNHSIINNLSLEPCHRKETILPTILAKVQDNQGNFVNCRVLLDSGSQASFIVESFAQKLGLRRKHARIPILGLSTTDAGYTKGCISLQIYSRYTSDSLTFDAFILNKLTSNLPSQPVDICTWSQFSTLKLADPNFSVPSPIDILLGADKLWSILKGEQIKGPIGTPIAQSTTFGWVITGEIFDQNISGSVPLSSLQSTLDIDVLLQKFWELEEIGPSKNQYTDPTELHFQKTFSRSLDGRYIVRLPFTTSSPTFGNTLQSAVSRLHAMERRFQTNPVLYRSYSTFMQEYISLGHMRRISSQNIETPPGKQFYLPHHAVFKPDSSSTKLRVVFDGSAKDSVGQSLNSQLLVGPPIQRDLLGVCLRFRRYRFVFTADIVKMFRQIWIDDEDINYQRIVWRKNPSDEIQHYQLRMVTYGTASAPFLSVRVLKQLAEDYQVQYPISSRILLNDVYVDDIMTGADTVEDLIKLQRELVELLSKAKFQLRKWTSNCWALLSRLPKEECEFSWIDPEQSQTIKVLGMFWNPTIDQFSFQLGKLIQSSVPTRRSLLSEISRIFDPLGFLSPSVVLFKILFQELWSSELGLSWDDVLPSSIAKKWAKYKQELHHFERIRIPRHISSINSEGFEIHGFCDASSVAYAAVVYARFKTKQGEFKTNIIVAKTKVAPLKPVSIPRLELCGALLLARLVSFVKSSIPNSISRIVAWCDSEIVIHWLSSPPRRWNTFVANRTAAILDAIPRKFWHHIASESNPADCGSRGVFPSQLVHHPLWWTGPPWLSTPEENWPDSVFVIQQDICESVALEEKQPSKHLLFAATTKLNVIQKLINNISSWYRLKKIVAYVLRFISNCRSTRLNKCTSRISTDELRRASITIIRQVQSDAFKDDIHQLSNSRPLPNNSKLLKYSPFIDQNGVLRVGGRIKHSFVPYNIKHPIILPKNNHASFLIVTDIHVNHLHTGVSETFVILRQQYWILGSRNLIRKIVHSCKTCFMQKKHTTTQLMGNLPSQRLQPSRPFTHTGCDYAGPITIRLSRGRNPKFSKAYIALFVCMSTKAIHLEAVSDLTTDAFIAALRRFVSRRGRCTNIYTDNGSNFQGARRCLDEMQKAVMSQTHNEDIAAALAKDGISWHFIPPSAPHFGGLWEAGVRSVKLHLRRVIGKSVLTFEELYTVLTQIEAILNSRPLCSISDEDLNPLTPSHFLVGEPLTTVPEPSLLETPENRLTHWNCVQNMVQGFWKRWHTEYITTLQERPKWQQTKLNVKDGDLVVIKEPNLPPTKWLLGRIEAVFPGTDNRVRVAKIRTSKGTFIRPIVKIAVLPIS